MGEDEIEKYVVIARQARQRDWWHKYDDVLPDWFEGYLGLEAEASTISTYESDLVVGGSLLGGCSGSPDVVLGGRRVPLAEAPRAASKRGDRRSVDNTPFLVQVLLTAAFSKPLNSAELF